MCQHAIKLVRTAKRIHSRHNTTKKNAKAYGGSRSIAPFILNPASKWGELSNASPPPEKISISTQQGVGGAQSRFGRFGEEKIIFLLQRIEPQNVQSID